MASKIKPESIAEYILASPGEAQEKLWQMHECIIASAPAVTEGMKWGMPAYSYQRILVAFAVFKNHIGFYPTPSAVQAFAKNLTKYKTADASIQFSLDKPLPLSLICKITMFRVRESLEGDAKWKS